MCELVLQQTVNMSVLVKEFWNRKESKEEVSMKWCFAVYACIDICEAYKNWMGHAIPGNN